MVKYFVGLIFISSYVVAFSSRALSGSKECSSGPIYWCRNITNAKNCNAMKHCIQTVWEFQKPIESGDSICELCKNMVKDAREQLVSNATQEEIKEVFEGLCKFLHEKKIVEFCISFADEYAQELVDMLSSQMNPSVICSVAGLCNNAEADKTYQDIISQKSREEKRTKELQKDCEPCLDFADFIKEKIEKATPEDIKSYMYERCGSLGSLSVACSNLVDEYGDEIYEKLKREFTPFSLCYITSSCVNGYTRKIQIKTESDVGVIHVNSDAISVAVKHLSEDQTCELCMKLVQHLKDVLVANTTREEFKDILKGLCKQMKKFSTECVLIADEYYDKIYSFITNDLDGKEVCTFAGICTKPTLHINGPIASIFPEASSPNKGSLRAGEEGKIGRISIYKSDSGVHVFSPVARTPVKVEISFGDPLDSKFQLPIERITLPHVKDLEVNNRETCMFCQYLLHYVQKVITQPYGEKALKEIMDNVCTRLPESLSLQCRNFISEFGDAFVAILAQRIDPSQVCPSLHICPAKVLEDKYEPLEVGGSPTCPFCLLAIEDIIDKLKDNKTESSIKKALQGLCLKMPKNLKVQCDEFIKIYSDGIIEMILADFTPQEVCTFLKLCHVNADVELVPVVPGEKHEIMTNEIPREPLEDYVHVEKKTPPMCLLCEFVMDKIRDELKNNQSEEDLERIVRNICTHLPQSLKSDCRGFIHNYSKYIVDMLKDDMDPRMVCREMHMCREHDTRPVHIGHMIKAVEECAICEAIVGAIRGLLEDKNFDRDMSRYAVQICYSIPFLRPNQIDNCRSMVLSYGPSIIHLLVEFEVRQELICSKIELCDKSEQRKVELLETTTSEVIESHPQKRPHLIGGNSCTWGPSYWCQSEDHAKKCGTLAHCREMVWKADMPVPAA